MLDLYKKLEADGKIGKFYKDAQGVMRAKPFQEFPKSIMIEGKEYIVNSQREELALLSRMQNGVVVNDPVVQERNELLDMVAERDSQTQDLQKALAAKDREIEEMRRALTERLAKADAPVAPVPVKKA